MTRRPMVATGALLGALVASLALASPAVEERPLPLALASEARLAKRLTLTWPRITVAGALDLVRRETGVPVSAAVDVAAEPLVAVVRDLPARTLLEQIGLLLEMDWTPSGEEGSAFQLTRSGARRQAEVAAVAAERREALAGITDILRRVEQYERLRPDELRQRERQAADALARLLDGKSPNPSRHRGAAELMKELQALRVLSRPHAHLAAAIVRRLPASAIEDLLAGYTVVLSTSPSPGELPLPAESRERLIALIPSVGAEGGDTQDSQERRAARQGQWRGADGYRAAISLNVVGTLDRYGSLAARFDPIGPGLHPFEIGVSVDVKSPTTRLERVQESRAARAARLSRDPVLGRRARWNPPAGPGDGQVAHQAATLERISQIYGVSILSQAYRPPWRTALFLEGEPALYQVLDRFTDDDRQWDADGELIRITSPAAIYERRGFVPDAVFAEWRARRAAGNELSLDEIAAIADTLTETQLMLGADADPEERPRLLRELAALRLEPRALRFWNRLSVLQRRMLEAGWVIPAQELEPGQFQALSELNRGMERFDGSTGTPPMIRARRPRELLAVAEIRFDREWVSVTNEQGMNETVHRMQSRLRVRLPDGTEDVYRLY